MYMYICISVYMHTYNIIALNVGEVTPFLGEATVFWAAAPFLWGGGSVTTGMGTRQDIVKHEEIF